MTQSDSVFLITVPPANTARRNVPQTPVSVPKKAAIKFAKTSTPAASRQTVMPPQKPVQTVPALTPSKPAGHVTQDIMLPEVLASQTAPAPVMTVIQEVYRQMPNTPQKPVPTVPALTSSKPAGLATRVIQNLETAALKTVPTYQLCIMSTAIR